MGHAKERAEYEARYDRLTVEHFRNLEQLHHDLLETHDAPVHKGAAKMAYDMSTYFRRGDWWERKRGVIEEWMERDLIFDEIESQAPYQPVRCDTCGKAMEPQVKAPQLNYDDPAASRMMHLYRCPDRQHRGKAVYTDGREKVFEPARCDVCNSTDIADVRKTDPEEVVSTCQACGHVDRLSLDVSSQDEKPDPNFEADRKECCMTEEEGREYLANKLRMEQFKAIQEAQEERQKNQHLYDDVAKIQKLTVFQIEKKIRLTLEAMNFVNVRFEKAETGQFVTIPFSFQETKDDRRSKDAEASASKTLQDLLASTNWRLMGTLSSRLGQLEGSLKGYDGEQDLLTLAQKNRKSVNSLISSSARTPAQR